MAPAAKVPQVEITDAEVVKWFPKSKFGAPNEDAIRTLTKRLEYTRRIGQALENEGLTNSKQKLVWVVKAATALGRELLDLKDSAGRYASGPEITNLLAALDAFLCVAQPRSRGRQQPEWIKSAARWSPLVAACLERKGKQSASQTSDAGPVMAVLSNAVYRIYGIRIKRENIGRRLRNLK